MREALRQLVHRMERDNIEEREEAILQLAMLLEKCSVFHDEKVFYESILEPELLSIDLDESEKEELIDELFTLIQRVQPNSSLIWALGKGDVPLGMSRLIELLHHHRMVLSDEAKLQALTVINKWLSGDAADPLLQKMSAPARGSDLKDVLKEFEQHDVRMRVLVRRVTGKL